METGMTIRHQGRELTVHIDEEHERFYVLPYDDDKTHAIGGSSVQEVRERLRKVRAKLDIPFTRITRDRDGDYSIQHGKVTGVRVDGRSLLVTFDGGSKAQLTGYETRDSMKRLDEPAEAELTRLLDVRKAAEIAVEAFITGHSINLMREAKGEDA